jgi:predicted chitinase
LAEIKETKVAVASTVQKINAGDLTINAARSVTRTDFVLIDHLSVDMLRPAFPATSSDNIAKNLPYIQAALKEFHIVTPQLIAFTFATMRADNESFNPMSERQSSLNTTPGGTPFDKYEPESPTGRALGNEQKGDGALFKGRGFVLITGRANYARMSARLGVDLVGFPDRANDPEVAARVLCAFIADHQDRIRPALDANDLGTAVRIVTGGLAGLPRFTQTYQTILAALRADPSNYQVFVQFYGDLDRDVVRKMMTDLRDAGGWNVQGVAGGGEQTQAAKGYSEVRFAAGSEKAAQSLAASVQDSKLIDKSIVPKLNDNVAPGTLEIWLSK